MKKFENRKNKTTLTPQTQKVGEVKVVLDFRFGQLFINKTEIMIGYFWQLISGQWAEYAKILFFHMKPLPI